MSPRSPFIKGGSCDCRVFNLGNVKIPLALLQEESFRMNPFKKGRGLRVMAMPYFASSLATSSSSAIVIAS